MLETVKLSRLGGYEVLAEIKSGGMGEVLLARRSGVHRFEKLVALKIIRADKRREPELRAMFLDEARLMARLDHPCVAQVHDFGEQENLLYLVMEYVAGISFRELIRRSPPPAVAARAMAEVCQGLHAAHELRDRAGRPMNVVHRDVSPENLMLTFEGRVKILDFGIALVRDRETPETEYGQIKGKPAYMAPEQLDNRPLDRRSDVFAASTVLHELLTGQRLFTGESILAIARSIERGEIIRPSALAGGLPPRLDEIVLKGLDRNPPGRFQNALEMAHALDEVVASERGEDLASFARRELAGEREAHDRWLHQVLAGEESGGDKTGGRAEGIATAPMKKPVSGHPIAEAGAGHDRATVPGEAPAAPARQEQRRTGWPRAGFLVALVAAGGAWLVFELLDTPRPGDIPSFDLPDRQVIRPVPDPGPAADTGVTAVEAGTPETGPREPAEESPKPRVKPRTRRVTRKKVQPAKDGAAKTDPAPDPATADPIEPAAFGSVTMGADPYAIVWIDGKQVGTTPLVEYRIPAGRHEIVLVSPNTGKVRLRKKLTVEADKNVEIVVP